jgi:peptide subunit release factor 1 (eRF1)
MYKILVEIMLPAAQTTYDVYIPPDSKISEVIGLLAPMFSQLADGKYKPTETNLLCYANTGAIFDMNKSAAELGITNGSRRLLIKGQESDRVMTK